MDAETLKALTKKSLADINTHTEWLNKQHRDAVKRQRTPFQKREDK